MRGTRAFLTTIVALLALGAAPSVAPAGSPAEARAAGPGYGAQIIGGSTDRYRDVKWIAAVLERGPGSRFQRQFCGGSLVAPRYLLTAAHCVTNPRLRPPEVQVLLGSKDLGRGGTVRNLVDVEVYPRYSVQTNSGDMAILELARPVGYRPVRLVHPGGRFTGELSYIAGWGSTTGGNSYPRLLRSALVPIRPDSACSGPFPTYISSTMLCAGDGVPDTCFGDSGGPLAKRLRGRWTLVGVTSFGSDSCGSEPSVYAWVGSNQLHGWIQNQLRR